MVRPVFAEIDAGKIEAITSTITLLEVLVHPFRTNNETFDPALKKVHDIEVLVLDDFLTR